MTHNTLCRKKFIFFVLSLLQYRCSWIKMTSQAEKLNIRRDVTTLWICKKMKHNINKHNIKYVVTFSNQNTRRCKQANISYQFSSVRHKIERHFFEMRKNRITAHRIQHCENTICDPIPELKQNLKFVLRL